MSETTKLTSAKLDEIYNALLEAGAKPIFGKKGQPLYTLEIRGTKEEIEAMKKKLKELNPNEEP